MEELASLGFISVIPAILAIVLSFATKNTIVALAIACIAGTTLTGLAQGTNLLETLLLGFPTLLKENLGNTSFSWVMLLNTFIDILVAYFQKTGAIQGFSQWVHDKHLSRRGAQLAAWVLGMFVYFSDSFSPLAGQPISAVWRWVWAASPPRRKAPPCSCGPFPSTFIPSSR